MKNGNAKAMQPAPPPRAGAVELHIERLVLEGFGAPGAQVQRFAAEFTRELERRLAHARFASGSSGAPARRGTPPGRAPQRGFEWRGRTEHGGGGGFRSARCDSRRVPFQHGGSIGDPVQRSREPLEYEPMNARAQILKPAPQGAPGFVPARGRLLQRKCGCGSSAGATGECEECRKKKLLQRRASSSAPAQVPRLVHEVLASPGRPLEATTRAFFEPRFGHDFSRVRVHDDARAAESAREVHALAYTVGEHITFGPHGYRPGSREGDQLLAHELAHTVQQRGLPRAADPIRAGEGSECQRLERDADVAATAAMQGRFVPSTSSVSRPILAKATATTPPPAPTTPSATPEVNIVVETAYMTTKHGVTAEAGFTADARTEASFVVDKLFVPKSKGRRGFQRYQEVARGHALQTVLTMSGDRVVECASWQKRDDPNTMRATWLRARGVAPGAAADLAWSAAGGQARFPVCASGTGQMDHIIELQLQGGNNAENLQPLDGPQNRDSGGALKCQAWGLAGEIVKTPALITSPPTQIRLRFAGVEQKGTAAFPNEESATPTAVAGGTTKRGTTCLSIADAMTDNLRSGSASAGGAAPAANTVPYGLTARAANATSGGANTSIQIPANLPASGTVDIYSNPANRAAGLLISGLLLKTFVRGKENSADQVSATLDTKEAGGKSRTTRLPLSLTGPVDSIRFSVGPQPVGVLRLASGGAGVQFTYPFLSPGRITRLSVTPRGVVNWRGTIKPSIPFLPRPLNLAYEDDQLRITSRLDPKHLRSPLPGFRITRGGLDLILAPELRASGNLAFALGSAGRPIATGSVQVGADTSGITATGTLEAHIPGVDNATSTLSYRDRAWKAQILVASSRIRLPYVQSGRLQIDIDAGGVRPSGELQLLLPRNLGRATLGFHRERNRFIFTGQGRLRVPGLKEVDISARYDGDALTATASNIGFAWRGLDGRVNVTYKARRGGEGSITGTGKLELRRGDFTGQIIVTLHESGRFSGRGRVAYPFSIRGQRVEASATIIIDPSQNVRVEGAVRLPQPIELFRRFGSSRVLFHIQRKIPIPGVSIGPVGVVAVIEGGISAHYGIGPGQLRNVALTGAFNPLAPHPDPNVHFHCELFIPANAGIAGTIGGGLGVDLGLGSVTGTLTVTAGLDLNATAGGPLDVAYTSRRFEVRAKPRIHAALDLGLSLDAHARARAGIGRFSVGVEKDWNLGRRRARLGQFSMAVPIQWASDRAFRAPSLSDIEWGPPPQIDFKNVLQQLFTGAGARETRS